MGLRTLLVSAFLALGMGAGLAYILDKPSLIGRAAVPTVEASQAEIGGPFALVDHNGHTVTDQSFRGRFMLVSFGFTYCPDVCPTELQIISAALDRLGSLAQRIQPVFVTVDPERDTPEVLASYLSAFNSAFIGLTGTPDAVSKALRAYRVYAAKDTRHAGAAGYTVNHSTAVYLMDARGRFVDYFSYGTTAEDMAARMQAYLSSPKQSALEQRPSR